MSQTFTHRGVEVEPTYASPTGSGRTCKTVQGYNFRLYGPNGSAPFWQDSQRAAREEIDGYLDGTGSDFTWTADGSQHKKAVGIGDRTKGKPTLTRVPMGGALLGELQYVEVESADKKPGQKYGSYEFAKEYNASKGRGLQLSREGMQYLADNLHYHIDVWADFDEPEGRKYIRQATKLTAWLKGKLDVSEPVGIGDRTNRKFKIF